MTQSRGHRSVSMKLWVRSKNCEYSPGENWYSEQKREEPMDVIKRETPRLGSTGRHRQDTHVKQFGDEAGKAAHFRQLLGDSSVVGAGRRQQCKQ